MTTAAIPLSIYQLRIVLRGISPLIWRRVLVHSHTTLAHLSIPSCRSCLPGVTSIGIVSIFMAENMAAVGHRTRDGFLVGPPLGAQVLILRRLSTFPLLHACTSCQCANVVWSVYDLGVALVKKTAHRMLFPDLQQIGFTPVTDSRHRGRAAWMKRATWRPIVGVWYEPGNRG